jgi:energy-coupling factor transporter ATP-binding protein EcfA2
MSNDVKKFDLNFQKYGWEIKTIYISTVAIAVHISISSRISDGNIEGLKRLALEIRDIAFHCGIIRPVLIYTDIDGVNLEIIKGLQRDQDWHRGRFLIVTNDQNSENSNDQNIPDVLHSLLHPESPDLKNYTPNLKQTNINEFIEQLNSLRKQCCNKLGILCKPYISNNQMQGSAQVYQYEKQINKIVNINISNFKGIKECSVQIDDADIVLITGPNGSGKSSFVQAITLAITGFLPQKKEDKPFPPHYFYFYDSKNFEIKLTTKISHYCHDEYLEGNGTGQSSPSDELNKDIICVSADRDNVDMDSSIKFQVQTGENSWKDISIVIQLMFLDEFLKKEYEAHSPTLLFRLSSFLPQFLDLLFDEETKKLNERCYALRQLFEPVSPDLLEIQKAAEDDLKIIEKYKNNLQNEEENIKSFLIKIVDYLPDDISKRRCILNIIKKFSLKDIIDMKKCLQEILDISFFEWKLLPKKIEDKYLNPEIKKLNVMIENKKRQLRELTEQLESIQETSQLKRLNDLKEILEKLMNMKVIWIEQLKRYRFIDLIDELKAIKTSCVKRLYDILDAELPKKYADEQKDIKRRIGKLENEINILEERMQSLISEHDFSHWNKFHGYLQNNNDTLKQIDDIEKSHLTIYDYDIYDRFIEDYKIFLNKFNEFLQWSDDLRKTFNDAINNVLKRFVMTEGLQQVNIIASDDDNNRRFYEIEALENDHVGHSKRKREHFSEGQKAQIATAWMITQRELAHAASNYICFPHRIIILDDPSATFDMTNLHSQAILLRQLAYHPDPEKRYQLFIVSHHEGFTSKLLDLLCPPEGCSMKLLRFKNWTPKEGPEVELFEVEQTPGSCLSDLEATLKDAFDLYKETV